MGSARDISYTMVDPRPRRKRCRLGGRRAAWRDAWTALRRGDPTRRQWRRPANNRSRDLAESHSLGTALHQRRQAPQLLFRGRPRILLFPGPASTGDLGLARDLIPPLMLLAARFRTYHVVPMCGFEIATASHALFGRDGSGRPGVAPGAGRLVAVLPRMAIGREFGTTNRALLLDVPFPHRCDSFQSHDPSSPGYRHGSGNLTWSVACCQGCRRAGMEARHAEPPNEGVTSGASCRTHGEPTSAVTIVWTGVGSGGVSNLSNAYGGAAVVDRVALPNRFPMGGV